MFLWSWIVGFFLLVLLVATVRACVTDARHRGRSPLFVALLVILFFPLGPILWIVFRPDRLEVIGARRGFRLDDHRVQ